MEISDNLEPVEPLEDGRYPPVILVMNDNSFVPPIGRLEAEGMLDNKAVLKTVTEQKPEAFPFIYLSGTEEDVDKRIL